MKRWKQTPKTYSEMNVFDDGDWVRYTDAQADKIAYGHASFENGRKQGEREKQEQVIRHLELMVPRYVGCGHLRDAISELKSLGVSEPRCTCDDYHQESANHLPSCPCYKPPDRNPLEKFTKPIDYAYSIAEPIIDKINAVIDAVNALREERE